MARASSGSSRARARTGAQEPRIRHEPGCAVDFRDGDDAAALCEHYWFPPDEWQKGLLRDWLARDADGNLAVITAGLSCPRQNGKSGAVEALELYLLLTDPSTHILHTAHQVKTAKRAFNRLARVFSLKRHKDIQRLVRAIRRTNGEEAIFLWHPDHVGDVAYEGASIEYSARSRSSNRGFDRISHVVFDECQELTDAQLEALMFTLGASETDRFMLYLGTPPGPTNPADEIFTRRRRSALERPTEHTSWHEWSVEALPGKDAAFDDVLDAVYETNPGMGVRLDEGYTREEFANASLDGFARERLGWWTPVESARAAIPAKAWADTAIEKMGDRYQGRGALAVKFSPDGAEYVLAGCKLKRDRSRAAFELVEAGSTERGTKGLAEALAQRASDYSCVVVDGMNGASALCDNMAELGCPRGYVVRPRTSDVIAAAQGLVDALLDKSARHTSQPMLDEAARTATVRPIGNRGGWGFDGAIPLEACALALWGARTSKRNPRRKQRILL